MTRWSWRAGIVVLGPWFAGCGGGDDSTQGLACGPGTSEFAGRVCLPTGDAGPTLSCGAGTHVDGKQCLPNTAGVTCGAGTHVVGTSCIPDSAGVVCGPGTEELDGQCVPDGYPGLSCGQGTHEVGSQCVADGSPGVVCGSGTHEQNGSCVPDAIPCGPGTILQNGQCVPVNNPPNGEKYLVFIGATDIPADGYSKIPVLVVGQDAAGKPSTASVVIGLSRSDAGSVNPTTTKLGPAGSTAWFTPCKSSAAGCLGAFNVTLALASAPSTVIATSAAATLVAPTGVGSPAPCLTGGNVLFFNGDAGDYIHSGIDTIKLGNWSAKYSTYLVSVSVDPSSQTQGLWWDAYFSTQKLNQAIAVGVYTGAERWPFESAGKPGLDVSGDGKGCNMLTGKYQVHDLTVNGTTLQSFTATFEQHCEGGTPALHGCVHFEQ